MISVILSDSSSFANAEKNKCDQGSNQVRVCLGLMAMRRGIVVLRDFYRVILVVGVAQFQPFHFSNRERTGSVISSGARWNCDSSKEINTGTRYVSLSFIIYVNFEFRDRLKSPIHFLIILRYDIWPPGAGPPVLPCAYVRQWQRQHAINNFEFY